MSHVPLGMYYYLKPYLGLIKWWRKIYFERGSLHGHFGSESHLKLFSWRRWYNLNWAYTQWEGFCDVLLRPLLGHFNYSRAGCNWSRLRGISMSMKMSLGVNTAERTLPPLRRSFQRGGSSEAGGDVSSRWLCPNSARRLSFRCNG